MTPSPVAVLPRPALAPRSPSMRDRVDQRVFGALYGRALVYNTCWEDPAVDRVALELGPDDRVLVITSAGCNALDYALCAPAAVQAVDANPRQNALLELKIAGIRRLAYGDFWRVFGEGRHDRFPALYGDLLRTELSPFARGWWDARQHWFAPSGSFYDHGLSGWVARGVRAYLRMKPELREGIDAMCEATLIEAQALAYQTRVRPRLFGPFTRWVLSRQTTMSMLGVPHPQRREVEAQHAEGVAGYVRDCIDYVARHFLLRDNHFWHVYLRGGYRPGASPEYLTPEGFHRLKAGLVDRVHVDTATVTEHLRRTPVRYTRFVLLDHLDWMAGHTPDAFAEEWQWIFERAAPSARAIFRSAHANPGFLRDIPVLRDGVAKPLCDQLVFHPERARQLTRNDRVHTYAGFHIADVPCS